MAPQSTPIPVGPSILWEEKATKSAPSSVGRPVGDELGGVDDHPGAVLVGERGDGGDVGDRSQHIRHPGHGDDLDVGADAGSQFGHV